MLTGVTEVGIHIWSSDGRLCSLHAWTMLSVGRWRQISRPGIGTDQLKGTQKNAEKRECDSLQCGGGRQDAKPEGVALELRVPLPVGGTKSNPHQPLQLAAASLLYKKNISTATTTTTNS